MSDNLYDQLVQDARKFETELGMASGFLEALKNEDDWSFVVKVHALIEAALTHALVTRTGLISAQDFFSHLELSGSKTGKLALAEDLDLLRSEERRFVRALSELRNAFVHDVKNVQMTLSKYFASGTKDKRKHWAASFCYVDFTDIYGDEQAVKRLDEEPKQAIWSTAIFIVAILKVQLDTDLSNRRATEFELMIARAREDLTKPSSRRDEAHAPIDK